jgi:PKD repeat protein
MSSSKFTHLFLVMMIALSGIALFATEGSAAIGNAPVINSVVLNNTTPVAGTQIHITADVSDVENVSTVNATLDATTISLVRTSSIVNTWEGNFTVVAGTKSITVVANDNDGNVVNRSVLYTTDKPIISSVRLSNDKPIAGMPVTVYAIVTSVNGNLTVKANGTTMAKSGNINEYILAFNAEAGAHFVNISATEDKYNTITNNNSTTYNATVSNNTAPVINNITLNNSTPYVGDLIKVKVGTTDVNGSIASVVANGTALTLNNTSGLYEGNITALLGVNIVSVNVTDNGSMSIVNNTTTYTGINKTVVNDSAIPVIVSITLNNTTPYVGDIVNITVNATDDIGVVSVTANGSNLTNMSGLFVGSFIAINGTNNITVGVRDAAGNVIFDNNTVYTAKVKPVNNTTNNTTPEVPISCNASTSTNPAAISITELCVAKSKVCGSPALQSISGVAPFGVVFTTSLTGTNKNIVSWNWSFEPVDPADYYSQHAVSASHTFKYPGVYNVTLTVRNSAGDVATMTKCGMVVVYKKGTTDCTNTCPTTTCTKPASSGSCGTPKATCNNTCASTATCPTKTCGTTNTCTSTANVCNTGNTTPCVSTANTCTTGTKDTTTGCSSSGIGSVYMSGYAPLKVKFSDKTQCGIKSRTWNFGDGKGSSCPTPAHVYDKEGKYKVTLTIVNNNGTEVKKTIGYVTVKSR